jgi:hypothetical protein
MLNKVRIRDKLKESVNSTIKNRVGIFK